MPVPDRQTVHADGTPVDRLVDGMKIRDIVTHTDDRGTIVELYDERWAWHEAPLVYSYMYTIRPGAIKGWGLHRRHEDRYALLFGEMEIVCFDAREDSPTHGLVSKVVHVRAPALPRQRPGGRLARRPQHRRRATSSS